ncbi:DNA polymerase III subunit delta' [Marinimicrobium sp. ABcell2]|uniref:DNA polymerase III subunit delta' n=1 Tax=Marinimicrobium sp. ABcell2 TaxID=3069751 RepID=UPI0027B02D2D|nr:DNA polymerase III subunit delta' [Marinimicrobium sp. ABcell2]MDQ2077997.1 DNA polymerase III subunit delta' [Marinimicrobium sp. ABcell2]
MALIPGRVSEDFGKRLATLENMRDFPALPYPWQQNDWQSFSAQLEQRHLPHALMLAGPQGIGKRHLAEALAQRVLCLSPASGTACGKCRACDLMKAGTHPDITWLEPEEPGKAIKIDSVRALIQTLGQTAQQGGYKVVIVDPAEAMNANASNALLKSLEEPAENTLLILISHTPSAVMPTIRSRCQMHLLALPGEEQVLRWLTPLMTGSQVAPERLLAAARGAPLTALALLEGDALEWREQLQDGLVQLSEDRVSAIALAAQWQNADVAATLEWLLGWVHDLARWRVGAPSVVMDELPEAAQQRFRQLSLPVLHRYLEKLLTTKKQLLSGANPNKQLLLEELLLDWGVLLKQRERSQ